MTDKRWSSSRDNKARTHEKLPLKNEFEFIVCNASFCEVFKFVVTFGKKGRLYRVYKNQPPPFHENCRCSLIGHWSLSSILLLSGVSNNGDE